MKKIETERLIIRNFVLEDWKLLREIILKKEASEYAAYDYSFPTSEDDVKKITQWFVGGDAFLAVCLKPDCLIGYIALNKAEDAEKAEYDLGYCFHPEYLGKGYATEACADTIRYAFECLGALRITSGTAEANIPSCKLLNRLGFHVVGESVASFRQDEKGNPIEFKGLAFELTNEG